MRLLKFLVDHLDQLFLRIFQHAFIRRERERLLLQSRQGLLGAGLLWTLDHGIVVLEFGGHVKGHREQQSFASRVDEVHLALDGGAFAEHMVGHIRSEVALRLLEGDGFVTVGTDLMLADIDVHHFGEVTISACQGFQFELVES